MEPFCGKSSGRAGYPGGAQRREGPAETAPCSQPPPQGDYQHGVQYPEDPLPRPLWAPDRSSGYWPRMADGNNRHCGGEALRERLIPLSLSGGRDGLPERGSPTPGRSGRGTCWFLCPDRECLSPGQVPSPGPGSARSRCSGNTQRRQHSSGLAAPQLWPFTRTHCPPALSVSRHLPPLGTRG